jgi:hypothetical protein
MGVSEKVHPQIIPIQCDTAIFTPKTFIVSSPRWWVAFPAMRPDLDMSKGGNGAVRTCPSLFVGFDFEEHRDETLFLAAVDLCVADAVVHFGVLVHADDAMRAQRNDSCDPQPPT